MNHYIELLRPKNCIIACIATLIGFSLITLDFGLNLVLALLVTFFVCGAGQAINDVFDYKIDKKINKNKPIPSKRITQQNALKYSIFLFTIGNLLALLINPIAFFISLTISIFLILYSSVLYKKKYFGNIVVAIGTALPFIFGAASAGNINALIILFAISAFFANMARELTKDLEDIKKDKGFKITLPMINEKLTHRLIILYYFISIGIAVGIFAIYYISIFYIFFIYLTTFIFLNGMLQLRRKNFEMSQKHSKKGMVMSLVAFVSAILR